MVSILVMQFTIKHKQQLVDSPLSTMMNAGQEQLLNELEDDWTI